MREVEPASFRFSTSFLEGLVNAVLGDLRTSLAHFQEAVTLVRETESTTWRTWVERELSELHVELGRFEEARPLLPVEGAERQDVFGYSVARMHFHLAAGEIDRAAEVARSVLDAADWTVRFGVLVEKAVEVLIAAGRIADAERLTAAAQREESNAGDPFVGRAQGRLALAAGDATAALQDLVPAAARFAEVGYRIEEIKTRLLLAEAHAKAGDMASAETELSSALASARECGAAYREERARALAAELGLAAGEPEPAIAKTDVAVREPEERLVTVMFADVRGYTAMSAKEAPAEMVDRVAAFHRWAAQEIERHHGVVDKFAGDAVMATFNVSGVRLDHMLHAFQAGIALRAKGAMLDLPIGVGIAVGPAVVGRLTEGSNVSVVGETTNLASRLQAQADAGELILSREAFRRVREWLDSAGVPVEARKLEVKGLDEPVEAHVVRPAVHSG